MTTTGMQGPGPSSFKKVARQAVSLERAVHLRPALAGKTKPMLVEPALDGLNLADWAAGHRSELEGMLREHRALLFRGFGIASLEAFQAFVAASSEGPPLEYRDRSTPRHSMGGGIYVSTIYPADQRINLHNEGTYWMRWAQKIYFCCLLAPDWGGETPIADVRGVLARLDPEVVERFTRLGVLYVRNYNDGLGLPWQEVFQISRREEVEEYCRQNRIALEWKDGDRLRTRQKRGAIRIHPQTGEPVWFNHAAFFHITSQEPEIRETLLRDLAEEDLPFNTYYGDGSPIDPSVVAQIRDAYLAEKIVFPWQQGDVLLLDNMTVAHAREPYRGERSIVVAMTEAVESEDRS